MNKTIRYKPTVTINTLINKVKRKKKEKEKEKQSYVPQLLFCNYVEFVGRKLSATFVRFTLALKNIHCRVNYLIRQL